MKENEIMEIQPIMVDEAELPAIISGQVTELKKVSDMIAIAEKNAEEAKEKVQYAANRSAGFGKKKAAIESLQDAQKDMAEVQGNLIEAQKASFEYQQKLGEITQYLFGLGVANIAANRSVVRNLEIQLKGASEQELNELARKEIVGVVKQLKAQEDMMRKQEELSQHVKEHEMQIRKQHEIDDNFEEKDREHDRKLAEQEKKDKEHDEKLAEQEEKDKEHDQLFKEQEYKNKLVFKELAEMDEKLGVLETKINELAITLTQTEKTLKEEIDRERIMLGQYEESVNNSLNTKATKGVAGAAMGIAVFAALASIIQLFI